MKEKISFYRIYDTVYGYYIKAGYRQRNRWFKKPTELMNSLEQDRYELHQFHGEIHGFKKIDL